MRNANVFQLCGSDSSFHGVAAPNACDTRLLPGKQRHQLFSERCWRQDIQQEITTIVQESHMHKNSPGWSVRSPLQRGITYSYVIVVHYSARGTKDKQKTLFSSERDLWQVSLEAQSFLNFNIIFPVKLVRCNSNRKNQEYMFKQLTVLTC